MYKIDLPKLHKNQQFILDNCCRFNVCNIGRRFGKDILLNDLAIRNSIDNKRVLITAPEYKVLAENFREISKTINPLIQDISQQEKRIELVTGGILSFYSLENFESIRGGKYHLALNNEIAMARYAQQAWQEVIRPTLTDYLGSAWFFSTPKGMNYFNELSIKEKEFGNKYWKTFHFTSYDNPLLNADEIDDAKKDLPELVFRQEYLAEFVEGEGTFIKREYLHYYDNLPTNLDIYIALDPAISQKTNADYTAICVLGIDKIKKEYYIIEVFRKRMSFIETIGVLNSFNEKYKPKLVGIEEVAYQSALVQEAKRTTNMPLMGIKVEKDKITRFYPVLNKFEVGTIFLNRNLIPDFEKELLSFPLGTYDDMVDSVSHAYAMTFNQKEVSFKVWN